MKRLTLTFLSLFMAGCVSFYEVPETKPEPEEEYLVYNPITYIPPIVYLDWWDEMGECANKHGATVIGKEISNYRWAEADSITPINEPERRLSGVWHRRTNYIYIQKGMVMWKPLIQHEMLHPIMWPYSHRDPPFDACDPLIEIQN